MLGRNVAGETQGGLANVSIEQVLVWNPDVIVTIDQEFAATVRNDPSWAAVKAVRDNRVHLSPKMPFGWVDFPPSVNRLIGLWWLAKILYPERFPEDLRDTDARTSTRVSITSRRHRRKSTMYLRAGIDSLPRMNNARSALPGFAIAIAVLIAGLLLALTVGRYPVSLGDLIAVLVAKLRGSSRRYIARGRKRHLAGARAARDGGDAGRRGARGGRHGVSGIVSQPAGLAGYSRGIVGRGAWRRARHLSLARRVRDPGHRLCRRADRGRHRLRDRRVGALARSDPGAGA